MMKSYGQDSRERTVDGYLFLTKEDAVAAQNEKDRIELLEKKINYHSYEQVKTVYEKAVRERVFKTPIGYAFLKKMQGALKEKNVENEEIIPIPFYINFLPKVREKTAPARARIDVKEEEKKRRTLAISISVNIALIVAVIAMFYITLNSDNPNILNYETAILNKYSSWEQDLEERESVVREKERELKISE